MDSSLRKIQTSALLFLLIALPLCAFSQSALSDKKIILDAEKLVKKYHAGATKTSNVIKVVYFYGKGGQPLLNWNERLTRTLDAVNDFYKQEFGRFGVKTDGVNFEKSGTKYVFTLVEGEHDAKTYTIHSGPQIQSEIFRKAGDQIDFSNDHVLVMTGLSYVREDGAYVFRSPYEGSGSSESGVCFASDCEMLDPVHLTDKVSRMKFSESTFNLKECGVAEFNGWYIGGIAHEMGHMLGLHHEAGNPAELTASTISLMGSGNYNFQGNIWGNKKTAILSAASVLQLLSNPVFTQSRKEINTHTELTLSDIKFEKLDSSIMFKANISGSAPPYAVSVLIHSTKTDEYSSESAIYPISATGNINLRLKNWPQGRYNMALLFIYPNGTLAPFYKLFNVNPTSVELVELPGIGRLDINEYYTRLSKKDKTPAIAQRLKILEGIIKPAQPVDAATYSGDSLYLSDAKWETGNVGWEKPARNYFTTEEEYTFFLENQGKLFENGLFAHSPSRYTFRLNKKWKQFSAIIGLRDRATQQGSARFTLIGDGQVLYTSQALRVGQRANININVANISLLELKADGAEGHNDNSWAVWLNPLLKR